MPGHIQVDDYLGADEDDSLENLKRHELRFSKAGGVADAMTRTETVDDYVVGFMSSCGSSETLRALLVRC